MAEPALYICPYCRIGFNSKSTGWVEACQHIKERHGKAGPPQWKLPKDRVPTDNLFELNTSAPALASAT